jgi:hypothetical protein
MRSYVLAATSATDPAGHRGAGRRSHTAGNSAPQPRVNVVL